MNDELERLRDVVPALLAERRLFARLTGGTAEPGERREGDLDLSGVAAAYADRRKELERAIARLREVAPDLFTD